MVDIRKWFTKNSIKDSIKDSSSRTAKDGEKLTDWEIDHWNNSCCPDCGEKNLLSGPEAPGCINVKCGNDECGSKFNDMGMFGVHRISDAMPDMPARSHASEHPYR